MRAVSGVRSNNTIFRVLRALCYRKVVRVCGISVTAFTVRSALEYFARTKYDIPLVASHHSVIDMIGTH